MRSVAYLLTIVLMLVLSGCQRDAGSFATVSGTIRVDKQLLSGAVVTLEPVGDTKGPNASAPVFNGSFKIASDAGLLGGKYRVRVSMIPDGFLESISREVSVSLPPRGKVIKPKYDAESLLECDLSTDNDNDVEFDVEFL